MKTLGLTVKYFPFPQPTSRPTDPGGSSWRNRWTIGQGLQFRQPLAPAEMDKPEAYLVPGG